MSHIFSGQEKMWWETKDRLLQGRCSRHTERLTNLTIASWSRNNFLTLLWSDRNTEQEGRVVTECNPTARRRMRLRRDESFYWEIERKNERSASWGLKKKQKKHSIGGHSCENKTADAVYCYFFVRMRFQFKLLREMFEDLPEKFWKEKGASLLISLHLFKHFFYRRSQVVVGEGHHGN